MPWRTVRRGRGGYLVNWCVVDRFKHAIFDPLIPREGYSHEQHCLHCRRNSHHRCYPVVFRAALKHLKRAARGRVPHRRARRDYESCLRQGNSG